MTLEQSNLGTLDPCRAERRPASCLEDRQSLLVGPAADRAARRSGAAGLRWRLLLEVGRYD